MNEIILEESDYNLCNNNAVALQGRLAKKILHSFLLLYFPHREVNFLYSTFDSLLKQEDIGDEGLEALNNFLTTHYDILKFFGDEFIKNKIIPPLDSIMSHNITATSILGIFKFYLLKTEVNQLVNNTVEYKLDEDDLNTDKEQYGEKILDTEKYFICKLGNKYHRISKDKHISGYIDIFDELKIEEGYYVVKQETGYGILDTNGDTILHCINESAEVLIGNIARVKFNGKYGIFDLKTGKVELEYKYDEIICTYIENDCKIHFNVKEIDKWGLIIKGRNGRNLIETLYDEPPYFDSEYFFPKFEGSKGLYGKNGDKLIPCSYENIKVLGYNYAEVKSDSGVGIYKYNGFDDELIKCSYYEIEYLPGVGFIVTLQDKETKGVIGLNGEIILPFTYKGINYTKGIGFKVQILDYKWGFYNLSGKEILKCKYTGNQIIAGELAVILERPILWSIKKTKEEVN